MIKILAAAAGVLSVATSGAYAEVTCASQTCSLSDEENYIEHSSFIRHVRRKL